MTIVTHLTVLDQSREGTVGVRLQGRLTEENLAALGAELETRAAEDSLRLLLELKSIKGYTAQELWSELSVSAPRVRDTDRIAIVCDDKDYRDGLVAISGPLPEDKIRSFDTSQLRLAWEWISS